jgi:hypothetical protein
MFGKNFWLFICVALLLVINLVVAYPALDQENEDRHSMGIAVGMN